MTTSCELFMMLNYMEKELELTDIVKLIKKLSKQFYIWYSSPKNKSNGYGIILDDTIVLSEIEKDARNDQPSNFYINKIFFFEKQPWWETFNELSNKFYYMWTQPIYVKKELIEKYTNYDYNKKLVIHIEWNIFESHA